MSWVSPNKWRRTIQSDQFSQTLVVNGKKVFEQDSANYFPLGLQTLVTAMVDPKSVLEASDPGGGLPTKANCGSDEPRIGGAGSNLIGGGPYGLRETVAASGRSMRFVNVQDFNATGIARLLVYWGNLDERLTAEITQLSELNNPDESLFSITQSTVKGERIRSTILTEAELQRLALGVHSIIWPQVLDGSTTGTAKFYISVDRFGQVREALPLCTANERSNDSAQRQILRWKFKPVMKDGASVQAESTLTFTLDTRAWGPVSLLSDAEARKLASNIVEPEIPPGSVPAGTTYTLRAAIDSDGKLIEVIAADGPAKLHQPCYQALLKWHFSPILQNGEPRPYRAEIKFEFQ